MAVGVPIAGTSSGDNGAAVEPATLAGQNIVSGDAILLGVIFYANSGTVPTAITWPGADANFTAFTQVRAVPVKDAAGVTKGIAGWAWGRALATVGGGVTRVVSANGTAGASGGSIGQIWKIPGCVSSGDPYEDETFNAPNYTATVDWPAATMTRSAGGGSVLLMCNSDNVNVANPTSWTALSSNASSAGLDSAIDCDYRLPGATGTYDPGTVTMGANQALGWATFHIMFTDTAAGGTPHSVAPADTLGLTDARTVSHGHGRAQADTLGLTDARTFVQGHKRTAGDTLGLGDATTVAVAYARTIADTLGLTDSASPVAGGGTPHTRSVADGFALTDARTVAAARFRTVADGLALTDARTLAKGFSRAVADGLALTDSQARVVAYRRTVADGLGLTDAVILPGAGGALPVRMGENDRLGADAVGSLRHDATVAASGKTSADA